jgi:hypothetical protein
MSGHRIATKRATMVVMQIMGLENNQKRKFSQNNYGTIAAQS